MSAINQCWEVQLIKFISREIWCCLLSFVNIYHTSVCIHGFISGRQCVRYLSRDLVIRSYLPLCLVQLLLILL